MTRRYIEANIRMCENNLIIVETSIAQVNATKFVEYRAEKLKMMNDLKDAIIKHIEELTNTTPTD